MAPLNIPKVFTLVERFRWDEVTSAVARDRAISQICKIDSTVSLAVEAKFALILRNCTALIREQVGSVFIVSMCNNFPNSLCNCSKEASWISTSSIGATWMNGVREGNAAELKVIGEG